MNRRGGLAKRSVGGCSAPALARLRAAVLPWILAAGAGSATAGTVNLDLQECRARALETAPELAGAAADVEASRLGGRVAGAALLPVVRGEGGFLRSSVNSHGIPDFTANNGENEYIARAVVTQPLYAGGSLIAARAKAGAETSGAEHSLASVRAQVLLSTDRAFFAVLATEEKRTIAETAVGIAEELLRAARVRLQNGEVPTFDVAKLELEVADATTALKSAEADAAISRSDLAVLIALPVGSFALQPHTTADDVPEDPSSLDGLLAQALVDRPDVRRLDADLRASEAAIGLAHGARLPQVTAQAAGGYDSLERPDHHNVGWQAGVAVSVPLWDWTALANRERIARLEVEKVRQRLEAARRAVQAEVTRRYLEVQRAHQRLDTSGAAERLAQRNAGIARQGYDLGLLSSLELITAQRRAITARSEYTAARYDHRVAMSELAFAAGRLR